jgi:hypothetical protein
VYKTGAMDWTGGARRRVATGRHNAQIQKQRAHFAKVRSAQQNTPGSQHSFRPDFRVPPGHNDVHSVNHQWRDATSRHDRLDRLDRRDRAAHLRQEGNSQRHSASIPRKRKASSIISISSKATSSSAPSSSSRRSQGKAKSRQKSAQHMTAEDELLMMKRKHLLARTDWLGLNVTRPLQMRFPSVSDRDRIGKRRKISKSRHKAKPANGLAMTPLFEGRLPGNDYFMSADLPMEEVEVKIGTEAMASQTMRSWQSHTPANTSMRHPSTEFGPISEESMLLGEFEGNSEAHEANQVPVVQQYGAAEAPPMTAGRDIQSYLAVVQDYDDAHEEYHMRSLLPPSAQQAVHQSQTDDFGMKTMHQLAIQPDTFAEARLSSVRSPHAGQQQHDAPEQRSTRPTSQHSEEDDDDEVWRKLLNIQYQPSSHASLEALKSSSLHITTSESNHRPAFPQQTMDVTDPPSLSTPKGQGSQFSGFRQEPPAVGAGAVASRQQSPPAASKPLNKPAAQLAHAQKAARNDSEDDEALWRAFVLRSSATSESPSPRLELRDEADEEDEQLSMLPESRSFSVSGLGTSDKATAGHAIFVIGQTSSSLKHAPGQATDGMATDEVSRIPHSQAQQTSVDDSQAYQKAHERITDMEDPIEDDDDTQPITSRKQPPNIHTTASLLNPSRFKQPRRQVTRTATNIASKYNSSRKPRYKTKDVDIYSIPTSDSMTA